MKIHVLVGADLEAYRPTLRLAPDQQIDRVDGLGVGLGRVLQHLRERGQMLGLAKPLKPLGDVPLEVALQARMPDAELSFERSQTGAGGGKVVDPAALLVLAHGALQKPRPPFPRTSASTTMRAGSLWRAGPLSGQRHFSQSPDAGVERQDARRAGIGGPRHGLWLCGITLGRSNGDLPV